MDFAENAEREKPREYKIPWRNLGYRYSTVMGWELRLWTFEVAGTLASAVDKHMGAGVDTERRTDLYLVAYDGVGVKLRGWSEGVPIEDAAEVEVKTRTEGKKRGAEKWKKQATTIAALRSSGLAGTALAADPAAWRWVRCSKVRRRALFGGLCLEQTDCELTPGVSGREHCMQRVRSVAIEGGNPKQLYARAAAVLGLAPEWELGFIEARLGDGGLVGGYPALVRRFDGG